MDPSYKNSNSGDGSGGMNPNGAMQPVTPAGPVVSEQPITPVQPLAPVQPVMPGQFVASAQPPQRVNPITHRPMGPVVGGTAMNQMSGQMTSPMMGDTLPNQNMMQTAPSGASGDIVLAGAEKKKPKLSTIIIVALAVLFAVVILVLAITRTIGGGGGGNIKNTREAFNRYANYYLYGEDKTDDVMAEYSKSSESFFEEYIYGEDTAPDYMKNIQDFFGSFYDLYNNDMNNLGEMDENNSKEYVDEYFQELKLVTEYYSGKNLTISDVLGFYLSGDRQGAAKSIEDYYTTYKEIGRIHDVDFYDLVTKVALDELTLVGEYKSAGCIADETIDYECVVNNNIREKNSNLVNTINESRWNTQRFLYTLESDLYGGVFYMNTMLNEEAVE